MRSERIPFSQLRLVSGLGLLDEWAQDAGQAAKNVMYPALFAILDGSVSRSYEIVGDAYGPGEFTVMVKDDLVVRVCVPDDNATFSIDFIGRVGSTTP